MKPLTTESAQYPDQLMSFNAEANIKDFLGFDTKFGLRISNYFSLHHLGIFLKN